MFRKSLLVTMTLLFIITLIGCVPKEEPQPDPEFFTVSFETFDGSNIDDIEIEDGSLIINDIDTPSKEGYEFIGWYKDINLTQPWQFESDPVTSDMTLYAKWELTTPIIITYTVVFESNGGSSIATQTIESGQKATEPADPVKTDYEFIGWYQDINLTTLFDFDTTITSNVVLYAKYEPIEVIVQYEVTYFPNKDLISPLMVDADSKLIEPVSQSETHIILGFYKDIGFTTPWDFDFDVVTSDIIIFIKWAEKEPPIETHIVTFETAGGSDIEPMIVNDQSKISAPDAPIKEGYFFIGWYLGDQLFDFNSKITSDLTLVAHYILDDEPTNTLNSGAYFEALWATFEENNPELTQVFYKESASETWLEVDQELIRLSSIAGLSRVDIVGVKAGYYDLRVVHSNSQVSGTYGIEVKPHDRSGYAHFNYNEGIGGYLDDGTLKPNAYVVYVTEENKDSITIPGIDQIGLGWILNNNQYGSSLPNQVSKINFPLVFRFIGTVTVPTGATAYNSTLNGGSIGDNGNMLRIKDAKHITIEGIGEDAIIDGWGIHFMASTAGRGIGFEARNLTFVNYPEDAIGLEGVQSGNTLTAPVERGWLHHLTFYPGYSANPAESDKAFGDGSADFKRGQYLTIAYSQFIGAHKTNLIGSSDASLQFHITMHHNLWRNNASRIPLSRQANIHMYNNVFETTDDNQNEVSYAQNTRANAYIFSEANYFFGTKNPSRVDGGAIKSFGDIKYSTYEADGAIVVDERDTPVSSGNLFENFDTNPSVFYYDSNTKTSDVMHLTDAITARAEVEVYSGTYKVYQTPDINQHKISNITPTVITDDVSVPDSKINKGVPLAVFTINSNALLTLTAGAASYAPVLVTIYGEVLIKGSGQMLLEPGTYVIESEQAHGASKGVSQAKESRAAYSIEIDSEASSTARLQHYQDSINLLPQSILYTLEHRVLIENARAAYDALTANEKLQVDETPVITALTMYLEVGASELKSVLDNLIIEELSESDLDDILVLYEEYQFFLDLNPSLFDETEMNIMNDAWAYYLSQNVAEVSHNFETDQYTSTFFMIATNSINNTKYGSAIYQGITYTYGYKMDSNGSITFNVETPLTLIIVVGPSGSGNTLNVAGTLYQINGPTVIEHEITTPGQYAIAKASGETGIFYMEVKSI